MLKELPSFKARPGTFKDHHQGQINTPLTKDEWAASFKAARAGELPSRLWTELYFQTAHDPSVAPAGVHTMSVFAQYVPHTFARGDWDSRRDEVKDAGARLDRAVLRQHPGRRDRRPGARPARHRAGSRPDRRSHLPGRMPSRLHVGQAAARRERRCPASSSAAPAPIPGGSVIAINGRNAAMEVLGETGQGQCCVRSDVTADLLSAARAAIGPAGTSPALQVRGGG